MPPAKPAAGLMEISPLMRRRKSAGATKIRTGRIRKNPVTHMKNPKATNLLYQATASSNASRARKPIQICRLQPRAIGRTENRKNHTRKNSPALRLRKTVKARKKSLRRAHANLGRVRLDRGLAESLRSSHTSGAMMRDLGSMRSILLSMKDRSRICGQCPSAG